MLSIRFEHCVEKTQVDKYYTLAENVNMPSAQVVPGRREHCGGLVKS